MRDYEAIKEALTFYAATAETTRKTKTLLDAADAIEELLAAFCLLCGICTSPPSDETFYSCEIVRGCLPEPPKEDAE